MTKRKIGHDYEMSDEFWNKIKPLVTLPKPKKKLGRPREDDRKIMSGIFYVLRTGCQWKHCQDFMEPQIQYMIDFRNGKKRDYLRICGKLVSLKFNCGSPE